MSEEDKRRIEEWEKESEQLCKDMEHYRKHKYKHRKLCKEWKKWKWCNHFLNARYKRFKDRIDKSIGDLFFIAYGRKLE